MPGMGFKSHGEEIKVLFDDLITNIFRLGGAYVQSFIGKTACRLFSAHQLI